MNYIYDDAMAKVKASLADIFMYRATMMTNAIDEIIKRGYDLVDATSMRAAWHAVTTKDARQTFSYRVVLSQMGRDATDAPISGTFTKVSTYKEVHANELGPVFVNIRKDVLKLKGTLDQYHVELEDFTFERFGAFDKTLALSFNLSYTFTTNAKFIEALLVMYRQRPREARAA